MVYYSRLAEALLPHHVQELALAQPAIPILIRLVAQIETSGHCATESSKQDFRGLHAAGKEAVRCAHLLDDLLDL